VKLFFTENVNTDEDYVKKPTFVKIVLTKLINYATITH